MLRSALTTALALLLVLPATAASGASGRRIAYVDGTRIYVIDDDGTGRALLDRLPPADGSEGAPLPAISWSPNGNKLAVTFLRRSGRCCTLRVYNLRTRRHRDLATDAFGAASWAPRGGRLAFASRRGLAVIRADGTNRRRVRTPDLHPSVVQWSPNGKRIAFFVTVGSEIITDLYTVKPDGSGLVRLTHAWQRDGGAGDASWSPNGRRIAYARYASTEGGRAQIMVARANGSRRRALTPLRRGRTDYSPAWAPAGRRIAFVRDGAVRTIGTDGRGLARVTGDVNAYGLTWSADAKRLSLLRFRTRRGTSDAYTVNAAGAKPRRLTATGRVWDAAYAPR